MFTEFARSTRDRKKKEIDLFCYWSYLPKRYDKEASIDIFAFTLHAKGTKALMLLRYFITSLPKVFDL